MADANETSTVAVTPEADSEPEIESRRKIVDKVDEEDQQAQVKVAAPGFEDLVDREHSFEDMISNQSLREGVYAMGWTVPTKIQAKSLPYILGDKRPNLRGQAKSGSGKTGCFALGMLAAVDETKNEIQAVSLAPTRELAMHTAEVLKKLAQFTKISVECVTGGYKSDRHPKHAHVLVATPGKLKSMCKRKELNLQNVKVFVLDEADDFIENFLPDVKLIRKYMRSPQVLLFSASFMNLKGEGAAARKPQKFADDLLEAAKKPPVVIEVTHPEELRVRYLAQFRKDVSSCGPDELTARTTYLCGIFEEVVGLGKTMIFCNRKATVRKLAIALVDKGFAVSAIHSDQDQQERYKVFQDFNHGRSQVLICTDIMARGIDIPGLTLVVLFELPVTKTNHPNVEVFQHRCGRAARKGEAGAVVSLLYSEDDKKNHATLCNYFGYKPMELPDDPGDAAEIVGEAILGEIGTAA